MKVTHNLGFLNRSQLDALKRVIEERISENPQYINQLKRAHKIAYNKLAVVQKWYSRFTGFDEVKLLQKNVIVQQMKLSKAQENTRQVGEQLANVNKQYLELKQDLQENNDIDKVEPEKKEKQPVLA
ncbi:hypothetical protein NQ318_005808 [Aromia moschata]|uniref:Uncharacterized protein n=1 Tax=Aromia moschata TaxID=1265417 RepID=A0AAV8YUA1_9CUCU|nr:hypothetical protein NQ318_005808 [Aromia moschata]